MLLQAQSLAFATALALAQQSVPAADPAEKAVLAGLRWLARHQGEDGSWSVEAAKRRCSTENSCFDADLKATHHYDEGLTALALLAFLDAGFNPKIKSDLADSESRRYKIGEVVENGLRWLTTRQNADGSFTRDRSFVYNEALATAALAEAFRQTRDSAWGVPAQKAVDFLRDAQRRSPDGKGLWGWRYTPRSEVESRVVFAASPHDADTSSTAACVLALMRAHDAGLLVEQGSIDGALKFCEFVTANDGLVGYLDAKGAGATVTGPFDDRFTYHPTLMSALGMCIRLFPTRDFDDPFLQLGAKRVIQDPPQVTEDRSSIDYYYWQHATLALQEFDGEASPGRTGRYWRPWSQALVEALLALQTHGDRAKDCSDGGWLTSDRWSSYSGTGPLYNTAMNVRTLEIRWKDPMRHPLIGKAAPDFEAMEEPGPSFHLSDVQGRVVLIDFLSAKDPGFAMEVLARASFALAMKDEPLTIVTFFIEKETGISSLPSPTGRVGLSWICVEIPDAEDPIPKAYGVVLFPTTVVVDKSGRIRGVGSSWDETASLARVLVTQRR